MAYAVLLSLLLLLLIMMMLTNWDYFTLSHEI